MRRWIPTVVLLTACSGERSLDSGRAPIERTSADPSAPQAPSGGGASGYPRADSVRSLLVRANARFMNEWPDPGAMLDFALASNGWTRAVYYEGLVALHSLSPDPAYYGYAVSWGESHRWGLRRGATGVFADEQCAGQTYIDLYALYPDPARIAAIRTSLDTMLASSVVSNWYWIDAIHMSMPVFAKFGALMRDSRYFDKMAALYQYTRNEAGGDGDGPSATPGPLYDTSRHLWWRDRDFDPPFATESGNFTYWSRGNGWVFAGLARVLAALPEDNPHRELYLADFRDMAVAIAAVQRSDGFWNANLGDPQDFGGPELTGTSLFVYGMAWGVRSKLLDEATFKPTIVNGWRAMASAVHPDGALGYVQGSGKQPADGQPVNYDSRPDFEDFGLGCFLLGGSEVARLGH